MPGDTGGMDNRVSLMSPAYAGFFIRTNFG